ncbi:MAG TPA: hypothetical protein VGN81_29455 [Pseudonocardiaceae bacterium]
MARPIGAAIVGATVAAVVYAAVIWAAIISETVIRATIVWVSVILAAVVLAAIVSAAAIAAVVGVSVVWATVIAGVAAVVRVTVGWGVFWGEVVAGIGAVGQGAVTGDVARVGAEAVAGLLGVDVRARVVAAGAVVLLELLEQLGLADRVHVVQRGVLEGHRVQFGLEAVVGEEPAVLSGPGLASIVAPLPTLAAPRPVVLHGVSLPSEKIGGYGGGLTWHSP